MRNRRHLYLDTALIRGRYFKQDMGGGGGTSIPASAPANTDIAPGNSGTGGTGDSGNNNTGQDFDASTFWGGQDQSGDRSSDSESASGDGTGSDTSSDALKEDLTNRLNSLQFGEAPAVSQEVFEQMQNGDYDSFNKNLNTMLGHAVKQALGLSVSVLKPFAEQLMTQVRDEINQTMGRRDDSDQLVRDFPAAKDPKIRPVVDGLYQQALKNTKGDRSSAVKQVKDMMRLMSTSVAGDLGLDVAPRSAEDSGRPANPAVNWLDELSARP